MNKMNKDFIEGEEYLISVVFRIFDLLKLSNVLNDETELSVEEAREILLKSI